MKKKGVFQTLKNFAVKHKIIFFLLVMVLAIAIIRFQVFIKDFSPSFFGFEFHHFDYGIILLIITLLLLLFGKKRPTLYLSLAAISIGVVIDGLWFIRINMVDPEINEILIYNSTLLPTFISFIVIILFIMLIYPFVSSRKKSQ